MPYIEINGVKEWRNTTLDDFRRIVIEKPTINFGSKLPKGQKGSRSLEKQYEGLFEAVTTLVKPVFEKYLGDGITWTRRFPNEFCRYLQLIARNDPNATGKDGECFLDHPDERCYIVVAMIMRVLEEHVLSSLLFGSDSSHLAHLGCLDHKENNSVFAKSAMIADANLDYLSRYVDLEPPKFWHEARRVTSQIFTLLLPLFNVVQRHAPRDADLHDMAQGVYGAVVHAAWLNVQVRTARGIVTYTWAMPGEHNEDDQINLSPTLYAASCALAEDVPAARSAGERRARVLYSVVPKVIQFEPKPGQDEHYYSRTLLRLRVVYYAGLTDPVEDAISLDPDFGLAFERLEKPLFIKALPALLVLIVVSLCIYTFCHQQLDISGGNFAFVS